MRANAFELTGATGTYGTTAMFTVVSVVSIVTECGGHHLQQAVIDGDCAKVK